MIHRLIGQALRIAALVLLALLFAWPASAAPIQMTDIAGRKVVLEKPAQRIVLGAGRNIAVLGLLHPDPVSLVAGWRDDFQRDTTSYAMWAERFPAITRIPLVGGAAADTLSVESVLALQPDLVVLSLYDAEGNGTKDSIAMLERLGVPVLVTDFFSHPLQNALPSLRLLGQATGKPERAEAFIRFYERHLDAVRERLASAPFERPSVFMHAHAGGMACCPGPGRGTFNDMIAIAGGTNIAVEHLVGLYGDIGLEQLLVDDPRFYVATGGGHLKGRGGLVLGPGVAVEEARESFGRLLATPGLANLSAIREGRAFGIWHMFNDTPVNIVMIEWLAKLFHRERFSDLDPQKTLDAINRDFLAVPMTGAIWIAAQPGKP